MKSLFLFIIVSLLSACSALSGMGLSELIPETDYELSIKANETGFTVNLENLTDTRFCINAGDWPPPGGYVGHTTSAPFVMIGVIKYEYAKQFSGAGHIPDLLKIEPFDSLTTQLFYEDFIDLPKDTTGAQLFFPVFPHTC